MLISRQDAARTIGVSVRTVDRLALNDPSFPQKIRIGPRRVVFDEGKLTEWVLGRMSEAQRIDNPSV